MNIKIFCAVDLSSLYKILIIKKLYLLNIIDDQNDTFNDDRLSCILSWFIIFIQHMYVYIFPLVSSFASIMSWFDNIFLLFIPSNKQNSSQLLWFYYYKFFCSPFKASFQDFFLFDILLALSASLGYVVLFSLYCIVTLQSFCSFCMKIVLCFFFKTDGLGIFYFNSYL